MHILNSDILHEALIHRLHVRDVKLMYVLGWVMHHGLPFWAAAFSVCLAYTNGPISICSRAFMCSPQRQNLARTGACCLPHEHQHQHQQSAWHASLPHVCSCWCCSGTDPVTISTAVLHAA